MVVELEAVVVSGGQTNFGPFSFTALSASRVVLAGRSGSGKTTLLRAIAGFVPIEQGRISLDHQVIHNNAMVDFVKKHVAYLPQNPLPAKGLFLDFVKRISRFQINRALPDPREKIREYMDALSLPEDLWNREIEKMSGGEKQRAALSILLWLNRDVVLLDEPTSAMDLASAQAAHDLLIATQTTIISASHDPFWIKHADEVVEFS